MDNCSGCFFAEEADFLPEAVFAAEDEFLTEDGFFADEFPFFCPDLAEVFLLPLLAAEVLLFVDFDTIYTLQSIRGRRPGSNPVEFKTKIIIIKQNTPRWK